MRILHLVLLAVCSISLPLRAEGIEFTEQTLDPMVGQICYALTAADVDGDGRKDIVAVTENRVVWFQNPDWKLRVIIENQTDRDNVCIAPFDIDDDGQIDFALGAGWTKIGTIQWLSRGNSLDDPWKVHLIGKEGWTHRMRFGDILGSGRPQLIVSPLNKTVAPAGARLLAFEIPKKPQTDAWHPTVLDESMNAMHNHWVGDLNGDGHDDVITASQEGVFLFSRESSDIEKTLIGKGAEAITPKDAEAKPDEKGNGEIKVGKLKNDRPFLVTVGPMHGRHVIVYLPPAGFPQSKSTEPWTPVVIESSFGRGHALGVGDFDGDGVDEIVAGHSDKGAGDEAGPGVFLFCADDASGASWTRQAVDNGGVATEDLIVEDFNGDGKPDIVAGGRATHNVKLYLTK